MGKRITWNDERTRKLLVILTDEQDKGCSKHNWSNIAKIFNAQTQLNALGKQVQNHHADLKEKFKAWKELQGLSGISYNPITKDVDVEEMHLERWLAFKERNRRYGEMLARKELANVDLLIKLFDGKSAHGVGGCFSSGMAKGTTYLTNGIEDLTMDDVEGSGDSEDKDNDNPILSGDESKSPPRSVVPKVSHSTSRKRNSEDTIDSVELKRRQTSFDGVIELLKGHNVGSSSGPSKAQLVSEALTKMEVSQKRGDEYFVSAIRYLDEEKHADSFLSLENDNQRWI